MRALIGWHEYPCVGAVLPRNVQKLLCETATRGEGSAEALRGHIARFLHDNALWKGEDMETVTPAGLPPRDAPAPDVTGPDIVPAGLPPLDGPDSDGGAEITPAGLPPRARHPLSGRFA